MTATTTLQKMQKLEELLTCGVCLEILKGPKTLPCGHIFCQNCLEWIGKEMGWDFPCPMCRKIQSTITCEEDVNTLDCSPYVKQALDIINSTPSVKDRQYKRFVF